MPLDGFGAWSHPCTKLSDCDAPYHHSDCRFQKQMLVDFKANRLEREHKLADQRANRERRHG